MNERHGNLLDRSENGRRKKKKRDGEEKSCRKKSEEMKGFEQRFETEDELSTRPDEFMKKENLHASEVKDL